MKYNQLFYNYEGIFRYLKASRWIQQRIQQASPSLDKTIRAAVERRAENSRWRKLGLVRDDLILEEHDVVVEALKRMPKPLLHGRYARYKVALQQSLLRRDLPPAQWTNPEEDRPYLMPLIEQVLSEYEEREKYDTQVFTRQ